MGFVNKNNYLSLSEDLNPGECLGGILNSCIS